MRRKITTLLCLGLLFISSSRSFAQEPKEITCTGKVIDAQGHTVAGAKVTLHEFVYDEKNSSGNFMLTSEMTTGADGTFSFRRTLDSNSRPYSYIIAGKEGLAIGWTNWDVRREQAGDLEIKPGQAKELAGIVVDENDKPVAHSEVSIYRMLVIEWTSYRYLSSSVAGDLLTVQTDESGKFSFKNLPAEASVDFLVKKQGYATINTYTDSQNQNLSYSIGRDNIRLVQSVESKIEGVVVEKGTEKPVAGVKLMITQDMRRSVSGQESFRSKDDGTFSVEALPPGSYYLQLIPQREILADWASTPVEVTTQAGKTNTGVKVELSKGGILEVLVTEIQNNQPVKNAGVTVREQASDRSFNADSGKDGTAQFRLLPGEYQLSAVYLRGSVSARRSRSPMTMESIIIEDGKTKRITHQVTGQPKVSGVVRDDKGNALKDVKLFVWPMGFQTVNSDAEGKYEITWDPEMLGSYRGSYLIGREEKKNLAAAEEINPETKTLDIVLQLGVIITGKVVDPNNKPIKGAQISVMLIAFNRGSTMGPGSAEFDANGDFEIKAIPPEQRYMLYIRAEGYGVKNVDIDINAAVNNRLDVGAIILPLANLTVSGVVVDVNDKPVPNVRIFSSGDNQPNQNTQTDTEGRFEIKACEGRIRINANSSGRTSLYGNIETEGGVSNVEIVVSERGSSGGYVPKQPPSLIGKSLPDLKDLRIEPLPDTINTMMLVCFWDMQQRPSRHCLRQLSKRAQELTAKNITVVAVHSKADENTLNQWMTENHIEFPVAMIEADEENIRHNWGVKSLPWMILTDENHVVAAEGFAVSELDEKI